MQIRFFTNSFDKETYCYICGEKICSTSLYLDKIPYNQSEASLSEQFKAVMSENFLGFNETFEYFYENTQYGIDKNFKIPNSFLTRPEEWYKETNS